MKKLIFAIAFIMALANVSISARADVINVTDDTMDYVFEFQEPYVDDNSIYIVYLLENLETGVHTTQLQYCTIIPRYTTDSDQYDWTDDVFFGLYLSSTSSKIYFNSSSTTMARGYSWRVARGNTSIITVCNDSFTTQTSCEVNWNNLGYKCIGYEIVGSNYTIESGIAGKTTFTYWFSDEYALVNLYVDILQEIALNNELQADELDILADLLNSMSASNIRLDDVLVLLGKVNNNTDLLEYYLDLIYKNVNSIYNKVDELEGYTDQVEYYLDLIYKNVNNIYNKVDDIETLLGDLINIFLPSEEGGESNFPDVDTSTQDMYVDIGDSLTSVDTTNQQADLDIDVNTNSGAYTWKLFNDFISSNGKVIGMYITLLSCAFIALILGR